MNDDLNDNLVRIPLKVENSRVGREIVLAEEGISDGNYILRNIPAFADGVAYGDHIHLCDTESGEFKIVQRSGQVTLRIFSLGGLEKKEIHSLIAKVVDLGGSFEVGKENTAPNKRSLLLVSLDINIGFEEIERLMQSISDCGDIWEYGNIYKIDGTPIGWWEQ